MQGDAANEFFNGKGVVFTFQNSLSGADALALSHETSPTSLYVASQSGSRSSAASASASSSTGGSGWVASVSKSSSGRI